jgi:outer membrane immunogenic protein
MWQGTVMKNISVACKVAGLAIAGIVSCQAVAADLPPRPDYAPIVKASVAPFFSWTGCYVGAQGGFAWSNTGYDLDIPPTPNTGFNFQLIGGVAGGHAGCNYQFSNFVVGIEGDLEGTGLRGRDFGLGVTIDEIKGKWDASVRGRVGYAVDRLLVYGTGGAAWLDVNYSRPNLDSQAISKLLNGWTAGLGLEYGFTRNWTFRVEYRYARFGSQAFPFTTGSERTLRETEVSTIRGGATYKF